MQTIFSISSNPLNGSAPVTVALVCIVFVLFCLLMALYLLKKLQERKSAEKALIEEQVNEARNQELEWYREKRFLMESQAREKHSRLATLINSVAPANAHPLTYAATRLFFLAETIREERQHLGTDISKLSLIDRRLRKLGKECINQTGKGAGTEKWLSKMSLCRQMIQSNREDLRKSQNLLRHVLSEISELEEKARNNRIPGPEIAAAIAKLEAAKSKLSDLPDGLRTVAKTTGAQAQDLFRESTSHIPEEDLHAVWKEQTAMDLFSSKHRPGGRNDLIDAVEKAISAFHGGAAPETESPIQNEHPADEIPPLIGEDEPEKEIPEPVPTLFDTPPPVKPDSPPETAEEEEIPPFTPPEKDSGENGPAESVWATPADFGLDANSKKSKKFSFNPFGPAKESPDGAASLVIFRSDNPEIWNTTVSNGDDEQAVAINEITGAVKWMGIKRIDTGEEVFSEIALEDLKSNGEGKPCGFNGSNEYFYGARHLGFFSEECPTEVETLFTYGGWGFGHLSTSEGEVAEQYCGWNGRQIPSGTVFEITLYEEKPEQATDDQVIL
ncbi:MAG: hypothetical protein P1V20_05630 [Verrucomicrobiales bacterium]|nr:hypothetical protein [Verrucomicrobiales bacterium]